MNRVNPCTAVHRLERLLGTLNGGYMKVIIDGVEHVPVSKANPSAEQIARGIMESFWGELPTGREWESEANELLVNCSDSLPDNGQYPTVMEVTASILKRLEA